ncbi:DUF1592 domain-containing protein [Nannocystis bainbridge]|uniref:DUF1592 domain-containing protein n=1 Tax=Nannocystis bainbridge TaxID=2995303 RepID=A0ABT5E0H8_9BACT|nr:DUF1592 domain-containing protein [Nannocystis bainbridge]MDC0718201.1 DUF1592 domain-containing protein [Nannocystis bainbridge]
MRSASASSDSTRRATERAPGHGERAAIGLLLLGIFAVACAPEPAAPPVPEAMVRRLTAFEYANTVRDVLGVEASLAREFPGDPPALGFDTVATSQPPSSLLVQIFQHSAESIADATLRSESARAALHVCTPAPADPSPCLRAIVESLLTRAWRRPPERAELERYLALIEPAELDAGLRLVIEAALLSPQFTFRWERDAGAPGESHWLDDHALAVRLSYFLWSSAPDDELLALAVVGRLQDASVLAEQVERMLADPRAAGFVDGFAGQWLHFRGLDDIFRDAHRYPRYDEAVRDSMREAMRRRFREFLVPGRDLRDLLLDTHAHVDAELAALYYLPDEVAVGEFTRIDLGPHKRRGLLTEPGLMTVLAYPFASAPTRRGRFVLEQLLCSPLPPPPPEAAAQPVSDASTARERLAHHRADPACAGCHAILDPIGLAFEHFDAVGAWRGSEHGELIDAAGELPTGERFADVRELAAIVADDPRFPRCVATHVLTYALGRPLVAEDQPVLSNIYKKFIAADRDLVALIVAVVQSDPFRARRAQEAP